MRRWILSMLLAGGTATAALALGAAPAQARPDHHGGHAVFVQTDDPAGNTIRVFDRGVDGTLRTAGTYPTGGLGGGTETGAPLDALASQGSLVYDAGHRIPLAVNAGSNTVTVFDVDGTRLYRRQVIASGGRGEAARATATVRVSQPGQPVAGIPAPPLAHRVLAHAQIPGDTRIRGPRQRRSTRSVPVTPSGPGW